MKSSSREPLQSRPARLTRIAHRPHTATSLRRQGGLTLLKMLSVIAFGGVAGAMLMAELAHLHL